MITGNAFFAKAKRKRNKMFSIIIPTMWKSNQVLDMLPRMLNIDIIEEIIIINNEKSSTPNLGFLSHPKIKMYEAETNLFVSPSWNLGAKLASSSILCFCQDDIVFDIKVFEKVKNLFDSNLNVGIIGSLVSYDKEDSYDDVYHKFFTDGSINLVPSKEPDDSKRPSATGAGNLFFIKKSDWIDIPSEIKIFHGEVLLWNYFDEIKDNYIITNFDIKTNWHTTWHYLSNYQSKLFSEIQQSDQIYCEQNNFRIAG